MSGKGIRAGKAYIELGLRAKIDKGLQSAGKKLRSFGGSVAKLGLAGAGTGAAIVAPLLMAASQAQEVRSKFDTVFGQNSESMRAWSNQFAGDVGRSRVQIEEFMSNSQDLFVPLGFDSDSAEELSKTVTGLAVDLASFNNKSDADVMNDLQAALTGSGEVMKKYGVIVNEAGVKQELLNQAIDPKSATEAEKAQARMNIIMAGTTAAQGDAIRTAGSFANQTKALKANIANLAETLGQHLLPPAQFVMGLFNGVAKSVMSFAEANRPLIKRLVMVVAAVTAAGGALIAIGGAIAGIGFVIPLIGTALGAIGSALSVLAGVAAPLLVVAGVVGTIGAVAWVNRDKIKGWAMAFWNAIGPVRDALGDLFATVQRTFGGIVDALKAGDISGAAQILVAGLKTLFFKGLGYVVDLFVWLRGKGVEAMTALWNKISGMFGQTAQFLEDQLGAPIKRVMERLGGMWDKFREVLGGVAAALSKGSISLAAEILWASVKAVFAQGIAKVKKLWHVFVFGLKETWSSVTHLIVSGFRGAIVGIMGLMESVYSRMGKVFATVAEYDPTGATAKVAKAMKNASSFFETAREDQESRRETAADARERQRVQRLRNLNQEMIAIQAQADEATAKRDALVAQASDGPVTLSGLESSAEQELAALLNRSNVESVLAPSKDRENNAPSWWEGMRSKIGSMVDTVKERGPAFLEALEELHERSMQQGEQAISKSTGNVAGTFSAQGASLLGLGGGGGPVQKTAENTSKIAGNTKEIISQLNRIERKKPGEKEANKFNP